MVRILRVWALPSLLAGLCFPQPAGAQQAEVTAWLGYVSTEYRMFANLPYHTANGFELRLTIYSPKALAGATRTVTQPNPTLIYFNGGGWEIGSKEHSGLDILPYLEMGWTVVTPAYRLRQVSNAPAAVEDARCALRWVVREARTYQFDTSRIVLSGGLQQVEYEDRAFLSRVTAGDAEGMFRSITMDRDRRCVCGYPPTYMVLRCLGAPTGTLLHYRQWSDSESGYLRCRRRPVGSGRQTADSGGGPAAMNPLAPNPGLQLRGPHDRVAATNANDAESDHPRCR